MVRAKGFRFLPIFLRGLAMGAAEVVPGVSGGTIALLVGVYERLVESIRTLGSSAIKELFGRGGISRFWKLIDGNFLVSLVLGMGVAILLFSHLIAVLLSDYPVQVWSVFMGLTVASILLIARRVRWGAVAVSMLVLGMAAGYMVSTSSVASLPEGGIGLFLGGVESVCAMILPGISGSFILLLLGRYHEVMGAVAELNVAKLFPFALGALVGLLAFSHILSWCLRRYHNSTIALLTGFMAGAIVKVWPWRVQIGEEAGIDRAVLPGAYEAVRGDAHLLTSIVFIVLACALVLALGYLESRKKENV